MIILKNNGKDSQKHISIDQLKEAYKKTAGIKLLNGNRAYPTAMTDAVGKTDVFVGRIRKDITHELGINLWVVADNVRKGAAWNALQIAELIFKK